MKYGPLRQPGDAGHTPGGSGAAVTGGIVPIAIGTDTMGLVRIPAAYCGVCGLKPTRGLIPTSSLHYLSWTLDYDRADRDLRRRPRPGSNGDGRS